MRGRHLEITPHAVERYRERFAPNATYTEAEATLAEAFRSAKRLHRQASDRVFYLTSTPTEMKLVVREPKFRNPALLTVLFNFDEDPAGDVDPSEGDPDGE